MILVVVLELLMTDGKERESPAASLRWAAACQSAAVLLFQWPVHLDAWLIQEEI